jgi:hypothetical protein
LNADLRFEVMDFEAREARRTKGEKLAAGTKVGLLAKVQVMPLRHRSTGSSTSEEGNAAQRGTENPIVERPGGRTHGGPQPPQERSEGPR